MINLELGELYGCENEEEIMDTVKKMKIKGMDDDLINRILEVSKTGCNVTTHRIKLDYKLCDAVLDGIKTFEIRKNDRDYKVGDLIKFRAWYPYSKQYALHEIGKKTYRIKYILSGYGLQEGYIAMAIVDVDKEAKGSADCECCKETAKARIKGIRVVNEYENPEAEGYPDIVSWFQEYYINYCPACGRKVLGRILE